VGRLLKQLVVLRSRLTLSVVEDESGPNCTQFVQTVI